MQFVAMQYVPIYAISDRNRQSSDKSHAKKSPTFPLFSFLNHPVAPHAS